MIAPSGPSRPSRQRPSLRHVQTAPPLASKPNVVIPSCHNGLPNSDLARCMQRSSPSRQRWRFHHPCGSTTHHSAPSGDHFGWNAALPEPPAMRTGAPGTPSGPSSASHSAAASQGMSGWSQASQASRRPSGLGAGAAKKSCPAASTRTEPSSIEIATRSLTGGAASRCVSRTASRRRRTGSTVRSANRARPCAVSGAGAAVPVCAWIRPSSKFENQVRSPAVAYAPPPYSCTRDRTLNGGGVTSTARPAASVRTRTLRPPSAGRPSSQAMRPASSVTDASRIVSATMASGVMGEGHVP